MGQESLVFLCLSGESSYAHNSYKVEHGDSFNRDILQVQKNKEWLLRTEDFINGFVKYFLLLLFLKLFFFFPFPSPCHLAWDLSLEP